MGGDELHNEFLITLRRKGVTRQFRWFGSSSDCWEGKTELNEEDLFKILERAVLDALAWREYSFEDFAEMFGFDLEDEGEHFIVWEVYKRCCNMYRRFLDLGYDCNKLHQMIP